MLLRAATPVLISTRLLETTISVEFFRISPTATRTTAATRSDSPLFHQSSVGTVSCIGLVPPDDQCEAGAA